METLFLCSTDFSDGNKIEKTQSKKLFRLSFFVLFHQQYLVDVM